FGGDRIGAAAFPEPFGGPATVSLTGLPETLRPVPSDASIRPDRIHILPASGHTGGPRAGIPIRAQMRRENAEPVSSEGRIPPVRVTACRHPIKIELVHGPGLPDQFPQVIVPGTSADHPIPV